MLAVIFLVMLAAGAQSPGGDRSRAEDLARSGKNAEAFELFARIVEANPADVEARLWMARLALRLGRTAEAERGFRTVLRVHPDDVDARIGLGIVLTRYGAWQDALAILTVIERDAGQNADLFGAIARAYRRGGDDRSALEYFRRARTLSPGDPDLAIGFEGVARTYGHSIAVAGFSQTGSPGAEVGSGLVTAAVRVVPQLNFDGSVRIQQGSGYSDILGGGGVLWRATRTTTVAAHALVSSGNTALPDTDISSEIYHHAGVLEAGVNVRWLSFADSALAAISPRFAWDREPWRLDASYTYSRSSFQQTGQSTGDHSGLLRGTWQGWRRVALQSAYAYGIESFENLTADRLASIGATTVSVGLRIDVRSLTRITSTWEHQWRSNGTHVDRVTVSVVQSIL